MREYSNVRRLHGVADMLSFAAGKTVERALTSAEAQLISLDSWDRSMDGVRFTDGTMLVCAAYGFPGTDVTPAEDVEVVFYAAEP